MQIYNLLVQKLKWNYFLNLNTDFSRFQKWLEQSYWLDQESEKLWHLEHLISAFFMLHILCNDWVLNSRGLYQLRSRNPICLQNIQIQAYR